jgi:hypothetical protein
MNRSERDEAHDRCRCGGHYENRVVDVAMALPGGRVTLKGVAQRYCPRCEARAYQLTLLRLIEDVMWTGRGAAPAAEAEA